MKIRTRILIFPLLLFVTFITIYLVLSYFNNKNNNLLKQTKNIYLPGIETIANLKYTFHDLQKTLQDIVSSSGEINLKIADSIADNFRALYLNLNKVYKKETMSDILYLRFNEYYIHARRTTEKMMTEDFSDSLVVEINEMIKQYRIISELLENQEKESRKIVIEHFTNIDKNSRRSEITNFSVALTGFVISIIIAFILGNALVRPIKQLNESLRNSEEELKQMNEELTAVNENLIFKNNELINALERLKQTQAQLVQSEKLASIGILSAGIAHEINNPLNFIQCAKLAIENYISENLKKHTNDLVVYTEIIDLGVKRASSIVERLNQFSTKGDINQEQINPVILIDNCIYMLKDKLSNKIEIKKKYNNQSCLILGNEGKLHQVILNIIENSIQAIEDSGIISISTEVINKILNIYISDTGCGISKENLTKIMDPFFTTKEPGKGTGLGLAIAYNILKEHNGSISVKSEYGKGTTVHIAIPVFCINNI